MADVLRIPPFCYVHVADNNSNVTRVEVGPKTFVRQDHEKVVYGPAKMITIPPRQYCVIANPHVRDEQGNAVKDQFGQIKVRHGDKEVRLTQDPFPLYVGEELVDRVRPLEVLPADTALRLRAIRDFDERVAGDEWLYEGPGTYIPRVEVEVVERVVASLIKTNQALRLRARRATTDRKGATRRAGEEWIVSDEGAYLPGVDEEVVEVVSAETLTETTALHIRALRTFKDVFDKERKAGEEWLVTLSDCETYIIGVYEELIGRTEIITLSSRQYCVVLNPVGSNGKPQLGKRELRKGERSFFLLPGEMLERGIQDVYVLADDEALLLRASETFEDPYGPDDKKTVRQPGDRWMVHGPRDYVPPVEVEVLEKRSCIPLDENEGIYVRDTHTGRIRAVVGESYLLKSNEELYNKELPETVEQLLGRDTDPLSGRGDRRMSTKGPRDPTRVVTFRAPHNAAVQVYDFKEKKSRIVFGPELVMLSPDEHFTVLSLSGGKPKRPHVIKAIALLLGPDFMTDVVTVETSDHARLQLQLSYNWHFDIEGAREEGDPGKIFQVPDFVGDACKAIASRVRGAVAAVPFDKFHKSSSRIIRASLFGIDAEGKVRDSFRFASNNLVITSIDIQSVEPVDQKTRDSLQKSVQLAIEITTKSQEATARHEADLKSQEARGKLERQRINDEAEAEKARRDLLELQAHSAAVESTGHATAEAKARAEAAQIEGEAAVRQAELHAKAARIEAEAELEKLKARQEQEIFYEDQRTKMEIERARKLAEIEAEKFAATVNAIGAETIKSIAQAGPEMQAKLLQGLGLKGYMITSGDNPINLFQTASGLVAGGGQRPGEGRGAGAAYTVSDDADSVA